MRLNTSRLMPAGFFFLGPPPPPPPPTEAAPDPAAAGCCARNASPSDTVGRGARPRMSATSPMSCWAAVALCCSLGAVVWPSVTPRLRLIGEGLGVVAGDRPHARRYATETGMGPVFDKGD